MWFVKRSFVLALSLLLIAIASAQQDGSHALPPDQFYSGTIVEITADKITVSRTVLGKDSGTRTFIITPETRIEGRPRAKARVTVRFVSEEENDRAIHIIVRSR